MYTCRMGGKTDAAVFLDKSEPFVCLPIQLLPIARARLTRLTDSADAPSAQKPLGTSISADYVELTPNWSIYRNSG